MNEQLRQLADVYLEGNLGEDETVRLEGWLRSDPDIKRQFAAYLVLHGQLGAIADELRLTPTFACETTSSSDLVLQRKKESTWLSRLAAAMAIAAAFIGLVFVLQIKRQTTTTDLDTAYEWASIPIRTVGFYIREGSATQAIPIAAGSNASSEASTIFNAAGGAKIQVAPDALFGFAGDACGLLYQGSVDVSIDSPDGQYSIEFGDQRVVGRGARFSLAKIDSDTAELKVLGGSVEIQGRQYKPRLRWSFDEHKDSLPGILYGQSRRVPGIIGSGAVHFDGTRGTRFEMIGGTDDTVSSGAFAFGGGITIECVLSSTWDGTRNNHDLIFRKEDGPNRILLGFQNDLNDLAIPSVPEGPVLSFGIFLKASGYSELDMPLDGQEGRPTVAQIADGQPHHVAATYDSFSGVKAIAIDGVTLHSHQFPKGQCIQSGGPKPANIGGWRNREAFSGTIDELAFYDYALPPEQIAAQAKLALQKKHWLGTSTISESGWATLQSVSKGGIIKLPYNHADVTISVPTPHRDIRASLPALITSPLSSL